MRPNRGLGVLLTLALSGCGGAGHAAPGGPLPGGTASGGSGAGGPASVSVRLTVPSASASSLARRPATISPATQSITVSVNGAAPQIFNVSSSCSGTPLVCTLTVGAPFGIDNFLIETWSGSNGSGTALNAATFTMNVKTSGNAPQTVVAGTLLTVTSNADAGGSCGASGPPSGCTLREAVAEASSDSGATTAIMFQGVSSITLASPISFQKNIVFIGPPSGNVTINGGGNQIFNASGNVVLSNMTLTGGNAASCGDTAESFAGGCGGAIELNSGSLTLYSTTFNADSATQVGGAIYTGAGTTLNIFNGTFSSNKVNASANFGSGGAIYLLGDATIDSSTFTNNSAVGPSGGEGDGGAITQSEFNTTGLTITNSQFFGNFAGGPQASGGAVYDGSGGPLTIQNDTFGSAGNGNNALAGGTLGVATGGALYFFGSTLSDGGVANTFAGNSATAAGGSFAGGGAIEAELGTVALSGANIFSRNLVAAAGEAFGGAIDLATFPSFAPPTLTLGAGNAFTSNTAATSGPSDSGAFGGAVNIFTVACSQSSPASSARRSASAVFGPSGKAHRAPAPVPLRRPAGVLRRPSVASAGVSTIAGMFTSNTAGPSPSYGAAGGALDIASSTGTFLIQGATFTRNAASVPSGNTDSGAGGAIAIYGGTVVVLNSQIGTQGAGNQATSLGGGVYVTAYDNTACSSTPFAATLTIGASMIAGNAVTAATLPNWGGGGIAVDAAGLALGGSTVASNSVTAPSGGGGGGGILTTNFSDSPFATPTTLLNSTVFQNTSSNFGGGIANVGAGPAASDVLELIQSTIYQNAASGMGGNLYVDPTPNGGTANSGADVVGLQNSIVAGGSAANPDTVDVYNADTIVSFDYNVVQTPSHTSPGSGSCFPNPSAGFCPNDINANPQLASGLANNGGPTQTIADTSSSPGRNVIPFSSSTLCNNAPYSNVDQRGFARGTTGHCDVGAYEFAGVSGVTPQPTPTGQVSIPISGRTRRP